MNFVDYVPYDGQDITNTPVQHTETYRPLVHLHMSFSHVRVLYCGIIT